MWAFGHMNACREPAGSQSCKGTETVTRGSGSELFIWMSKQLLLDKSKGHWKAVTHLRKSLAFSEAREALQELSSGLLRAVGRVWSSTVRSRPCFHCS